MLWIWWREKATDFSFLKKRLRYCVAWLPLGKDFYLVLISSFLYWPLFLIILPSNALVKFIGFVSFIDTYQKRSMNFAVELGGQGASNNKNCICTCVFKNSATKGRCFNCNKWFLHPWELKALKLFPTITAKLSVCYTSLLFQITD